MTKLAPHLFVYNPDLGRGFHGERYCRDCPLHEKHPVHELPATPAGVVEAEARRFAEQDQEE